MSRLRTAGLLLTVAAVLGLLASLVLGLGGGEGAEPEAPVTGPGERVRVEVLNAAGVPGLARRAAERLRAAGYDVVYYGNADRFGRDSSVVLDRVGSPERAERVAEAAGIGRVRSEPDSSLYLDVTVVLGRDWGGAAADSATGDP